MKKGKNKELLAMITMIGPIGFWMILFVAIPLIYVFAIIFMKKGTYGGIELAFTLSNYKEILNPLYLQIFIGSIITAGISTIVCLAIGYPFAYFIAKKSQIKKSFLLMLVMLPFLTNSLIRMYGWIILLKGEGIINKILVSLHIISEPIQLIYTNFAVMLGLIYCLLPFMILPLYSSIEKLDMSLLEAASDLGAKSTKTFLNITLPLTMPGIFAGSILVFIPALGLFFIADLLGGSKVMLIGNLIRNQFLTARNWPFGAALSMTLILITLILVAGYKKAGGSMDDLV
jgi:spermidine/putrescine transport system permease protein